MIDLITNTSKLIIDFMFNIINLLKDFGILVFWVWMLIDLVTRKDEDMGSYFKKYSKWLWFLIFVVFNGIGALFYFFLIYSKFPKSGNFDVWKGMKDMAKKVEDKVFVNSEAETKDVSDAEIVK